MRPSRTSNASSVQEADRRAMSNRLDERLQQRPKGHWHGKRLDAFDLDFPPRRRHHTCLASGYSACGTLGWPRRADVVGERSRGSDGILVPGQYRLAVRDAPTVISDGHHGRRQHLGASFFGKLPAAGNGDRFLLGCFHTGLADAGTGAARSYLAEVGQPAVPLAARAFAGRSLDCQQSRELGVELGTNAVAAAGRPRVFALGEAAHLQPVWLRYASTRWPPAGARCVKSVLCKCSPPPL